MGFLGNQTERVFIVLKVVIDLTSCLLGPKYSGREREEYATEAEASATTTTASPDATSPSSAASHVPPRCPRGCHVSGSYIHILLFLYI